MHNPMDVCANDFFKAAMLDVPRDTRANKLGSNVTLVSVLQLPGLNTLGVSIARLDFAPLGLNPPHTHPRATEIFAVLEGTLYVGFVTSNPDNKLFSKVLNKGDVYVFPQGLIHFQFNPNPHKPAVAIAGFGSQNPGVITIANAVFGSNPPISDDILAKGFQAIALAPSPLQDFCVADLNSQVRVNGFACKNPTNVTADDFFMAAMLDKPRDTKANKVGSNITLINVMEIPGLNTLGISMVRVDYAPLGLNPPHTHPRSTEVFTVVEGTLYAGFVTSNPDNKLFSKVLNKGDVFVFPVGAIHFQFNLNPHKPAVAISALSSQNPGIITVANAVFRSKPLISDDILAKAFQAVASDHSPLQDFCVADMHSPVRVNGFPCLNPMDVNADHFFKAAMLDTLRNTKDSKVGSNVTLINVMQLPDYAPLGENPPHTHPRATEILTVLEGTLYVGFLTSNQNNMNKLFSKVLNKGDVFVFPEGLIHFQFNPNPHQPAVAIAALSSQNPGAITIANAVFGSKPPISDDVLAKAFQVKKGTIDWLQAQFWENNHY
uniref:Cupin type-1 domain-containing protein n=1 Tax=Leersia perrieri TaxID=77586 RepID=A0A0D9X556_9ORYZ